MMASLRSHSWPVDRKSERASEDGKPAIAHFRVRSQSHSYGASVWYLDAGHANYNVLQRTAQSMYVNIRM